MKKAILYFLIFAGISVVMTLGIIFLVGFFSRPEICEAVGMERTSVFLTVYLSMVVLWAILIIFIFTRCRYASLSFGNLTGNNRWTIVLLSFFIFLAFYLPTVWVRSQIVPHDVEALANLQLYQSHPFMSLTILGLFYTTIQLVSLGAIMREVLPICRTPWIPILVIASLQAIPNWGDGGALGITSVIFAIISGSMEGWLYYYTRSIWPAVLGELFADFILWMFLDNAPPAFLAVAGLIAFPFAGYLMIRKIYGYQPVGYEAA